MAKGDIEAKRLREIQIVGEMIRLYCKGNHHRKEGLCSECQELLDYASLRSSKCPFMENKTFCSNCKVHCYNPEMRSKIKEVMRYVGARMLFHHPIMALEHLYYSKREKRKLSK